MPQKYMHFWLSHRVTVPEIFILSLQIRGLNQRKLKTVFFCTSMHKHVRYTDPVTATI
jgi:hypothetical protein